MGVVGEARAGGGCCGSLNGFVFQLFCYFPENKLKFDIKIKSFWLFVSVEYQIIINEFHIGDYWRVFAGWRSYEELKDSFRINERP